MVQQDSDERLHLGMRCAALYQLLESFAELRPTIGAVEQLRCSFPSWKDLNSLYWTESIYTDMALPGW